MNRREVLKNLTSLMGFVYFPVQNLVGNVPRRFISGTNVMPTGFKELDDVLDGGIHLDRKYLFIVEPNGWSPGCNLVRQLINKYPEQYKHFQIQNDKNTDKNHQISDVCLKFDLFLEQNNHLARAKVVKNRHGECSDWIVLMT